jgi:uncharacterized membrane protein
MNMFFYNKFGMDIYFMLNCFFIYSFLGWIFECIVMSIEEKAPVNRGFIRGPLCTIYGLGALTVYFVFQPIASHKIELFICGAVLATIIEVLTAVLMTKLFGGFWWNYDNKKFNYRGVICLESSLCWGLMTVLTFVFFQPLIERIVNIYYSSCGRMVALVILAGYCVDFSTSFKRAYNEKESASEVPGFADAIVAEDDEDSVNLNLFE